MVRGADRPGVTPKIGWVGTGSEGKFVDTAPCSGVLGLRGGLRWAKTVAVRKRRACSSGKFGGLSWFEGHGSLGAMLCFFGQMFVREESVETEVKTSSKDMDL